MICWYPHGLQPARLLCSWDFPGKNTRLSCHFLFQGIFLHQESNLHLLHLLNWQEDSLPLSHQGSLYMRVCVCVCVCVYVCVCESVSHSVMFNSLCPTDYSCLRYSVHGFSRQEYWTGYPFLSPRDLPDPEIEPVSPALASRFFTTAPPGKFTIHYCYLMNMDWMFVRSKYKLKP